MVEVTAAEATAVEATAVEVTAVEVTAVEATAVEATEAVMEAVMEAVVEVVKVVKVVVKEVMEVVKEEACIDISLVRVSLSTPPPSSSIRSISFPRLSLPRSHLLQLISYSRPHYSCSRWRTR